MKQQRFSLVIVIAFAACLSVSLLSPVEAIRTKIESRRPSRDKPNRERNLRTDYPSSDVTSVNAASNPSEGDPPTVLLETKTKFAGGGVAGAIGGAVGNAFVSNTASQKENCVGCKFVWKKIHAGLDQSAGYDTVKNAFERVCMNMPDVFYDVCDMMYDQEDDMVQDYLNNVDFEKMCTYLELPDRSRFRVRLPRESDAEKKRFLVARYWIYVSLEEEEEEEEEEEGNNNMTDRKDTSTGDKTKEKHEKAVPKTHPNILRVMKNIFEAADTNKDNALSLPEFEAFATSAEIGMSVDQASRIFGQLDEDSDNFLDFSDFQRFMMFKNSAENIPGPPRRLKRQISGSRMPPTTEAILARCVVKIWTSVTEKSYFKPWTVHPTHSCTGTGFVVDAKKRFIITNAHVVRCHSSVHVRLYGSHERVPAQVLYISEEKDLALLTVSLDAFWENVKGEAHFASSVPMQFEPTIVIGYPLGGSTISMTKGVVSRVDCRSYNHRGENTTRLLVIQIDAAINSGNSGGPVFNRNGKVVGVAFSGLDKRSSEGVGYIIPVPVVSSFIASFSVSNGRPFPGVCTPGFGWQVTENRALRMLLQMHKIKGVKLGGSVGAKPQAVSGVLVNYVSARGTLHNVLKKDDVVLAIDDHNIGFDGTFCFRGNDRLLLDHIVTSKIPGSKMSYTILRNGKVRTFEVDAEPIRPTMPQYDGRDATPEFFIVGGIVFVPLTMPLIKQSSKISSTIRETIYERQQCARLDYENVTVTSILPADVNFGYPMPTTTLTSLNGEPIKSLVQLVGIVEKAYEEPKGFFDFVFGKKTCVTRIVLPVKECRDLGPKILETYRVPGPISPGLRKLVNDGVERTLE
eukprot:g803.t1